MACEATAHVGGTEAASAATCPGSRSAGFRPRRGLLSADQERPRWNPIRTTWTRSDLVAIENTHQLGGGSVLPVGTWRLSPRSAPPGHPPLPRRRAHLQRCAVTGTHGGRLRPARGCADVLPVQGPGRSDRSLLAGDREFVREARRLRSCSAGPGGRRDHGRGGPDRAAGRPGPARRGSRNARWLAEGVAGIVPGGVDRPVSRPTCVRGRGRDGLAGGGMDAAAGRGRVAGHGGAGAGANAHPRRRDRAGYRDGAGRLAPRRRDLKLACRRRRQLKTPGTRKRSVLMIDGRLTTHYRPVDRSAVLSGPGE